MVRLYKLLFLALFGCSVFLHAMHNERTPGVKRPQDNSIAMAILRDTLRGGLTVPAFVANVIAFGTNGKSDVHSTVPLEFPFTVIPVVMHCLGDACGVKKGNPTDHARNMCNLFRCCYGALALYCMFNSKEII